MTAEEFEKEAARLRPKLTAIAGRYLEDSDETEDIVQDAMLKLWLLCPQLHLPADALASVLTRNLALDHIRRRRPTLTLADTDTPGDDTDATKREQIERMMEIVDTLPSMQQTILRLRHIEGMEYEDIAHLTCSTATAMRKALSRARMTVRDKYMERNRQ